MKIVTRVTEEGGVDVEVIDPTDGAVTHACSPAKGEQVVIEATSATSPADISFGGLEAIPEPEAEAAEGGEQPGEEGTDKPGAAGDDGEPGPGEGADAGGGAEGEQPAE